MFKSKKILALVVVLICSATILQNVFAFHQAQYFEEDFESGELNYFYFDNWDLNSEGDNQFVSLRENFTGIDRLELDYEYDDMDIMFDVRLDAINASNNANFGVSLRRANNGNDQYDVAYHSIIKKIMIRSFFDGEDQLLASDEFEIEENIWYNMGFRIKDTVIEWYIDGDLVLSAECEDHESGTFLIGSYNNSISIDNIKIAKVDTLDMTSGIFFTREPKTPSPTPTNKPSPTPGKTDKETEKTTNKVDNTSAPKDDKDRDNNLILIIIIAASALVIIGVLVVIIRRKVKNKKD